MTRCFGRGCLAVTAVLAIAGCAGVPDSGPVRVGHPVAAAPGGGLANSTVREVPAGPEPGASPANLVSGFLRAMLDSEGDYGVARSYLAPGTRWSAGGTITVYAEPTHVVRVGRDSVIMHAARVGVVGSHGVYRVSPGAVNRRFGVARRKGEWRITHLRPGILLSSDDAGRLLQPAALYFLTPEGNRLVPQPVLEPPQEPGLATVLMRELLGGPSPLLASAVRTAVPRGTTLVGNVPISTDGVADVDLSAGARQIGTAQLVRLSAQVVWTLRQLSSVRAVRLLANGTPLESGGVASLQPAQSWPHFDPATPPPVRGALLVHGGRAVSVGATVPASLRGTGLRSATQSADGSETAEVRRTGAREELLVGAASGRLRVRLRAPTITAPTFGPNHQAIVATSTGAVYVVPPNGPAQRVRLTGRLDGQTVRALALSHEGTRIAVIAASPRGVELDIAAVDTAGRQVAFRKPRVVLPVTASPSGIAWAGATEVVSTVSARNGGRSIVEVSSDGFRLLDLFGPGLPADLDAVAAAPGQHVLAADPSGTWQLSGRRWRRLSAATGPAYAGA